MRIGINALPLVASLYGGVRTYITNLIRSLQCLDRENEYWIFTNAWSSQELEWQHQNFHPVCLMQQAENRQVRVLAEQVLIPRHARRLKLDVMHSPNQVAALGLRCASVLTIHDLHFLYPDLVQDWRRSQYWYYRGLVPRSARKADRVIAVSQFTARDLDEKLGLPPERIATIYEGVDHSSFRTEIEEERCREVRKRYGLDDAFVICVGGYGAHKNLDSVVDAMEILRAEHGLDLQLVVLGIQTQYFDAWRTKTLALSKAPLRYQFPGHVPDEDLACFYKMARVFSCTFLFEGFGLPLLEAFACGCPVVCSNATALPEVAGGAAILVDPLNAREIARAVYKLCSNEDQRTALVQRGLARAQEFSWKKTAAATLEVYKAAAEEHSRG